MLKPELLEILVCPKCHESVDYDKQRDILICESCQIAFPVREDIPVMLLEECIDLKKEDS